MASSDADLVQRVASLVGQTLEIPLGFPVSEKTRLDGRGYEIDSVDALRLLTALEEEFDVTIEDDQIVPSAFETLGSLVALVRPDD
jgi:acyl carrier protein